jgi:proteasome component ECM29
MSASSVPLTAQTPAPAAPDEAKELALVNKVELRIALAEGDKKLEIVLKTFLAPLLLKLASPHGSVRNKVNTGALPLY